ncbi:MAG: YbaN family protein [Pseudomonadales bacterium]|nr:YbaN family protein [Pseudomonadales bacterium]
MVKEYKQVRNPLLRVLLMIAGGVCVILGVIGIFLPVLPTTPFLLLAAACYVRSSERFYDWLLSHPSLGQYVLPYLDGSGMPRKAKRYTLIMLWLTMPLAIYLIPLWPVRILLALIGTSVSVYIIRLPEPTEP